MDISEEKGGNQKRNMSFETDSNPEASNKTDLAWNQAMERRRLMNRIHKHLNMMPHRSRLGTLASITSVIRVKRF